MVSMSVRTRRTLSPTGPHQERQPPANLGKGKQQASVCPNVVLSGCDAGMRQQFAQRGHKHQRINKRIHSVQRPSTPRMPRSANLICA